jgi:hypothetical protein
MAKRMSRALAVIKVELRRRRHDSVGATGRWLAGVIRGWLQYHAVLDNIRRLDQFITEVIMMWLRQPRRRSQRGLAACGTISELAMADFVLFLGISRKEVRAVIAAIVTAGYDLGS